jgi:Spy/CpxP family protein refolding chaperone
VSDSHLPPLTFLFWSSPVTHLRHLVLIAALAAIPFAANAASTSTTHHHAKKPVHHIAHKSSHKKHAATNTQS